MSNLPILAIVVPSYNEEENILKTTKRLIEVLDELVSSSVISDGSFIYYVDDGSKDKTWSLIKECNEKYAHRVKGLKFSRNFGNQKAILAGLTEVVKYGVDCAISIDADLQQDETKIKEFIEKYQAGAQIVCGIRNDRKTDGFFKKFTALAFYKLMNILGGGIKMNHSDYRLIGKEALSILSSYHETNLFLRGIFTELGLKTDYVYFDVKKRELGYSKFTPLSLYTLALNGITSFSLVPLRLVTVIGFILSFVSFVIGLSALYDKVIGHSTVPGWATIVVAFAFLSGIQILCLGIMSEYLGQLFQEVKARPRYIKEVELN